MYLGIDLGTSELKLLLLDDRHDVVATVGQPLTVSRPRALWSEQDPEQWWDALNTAMLRLRSEQPKALSAVRGIGLSGQMHGAVLLGALDQVLRPAILWNDGRSAAQCEALEAAAPQLRAITGNIAMPGFTAPKLLWVRQHEPDLFAQIHRVLLPKDWLRLRLTGQAVSDMSDASGTLWLDRILLRHLQQVAHQRFWVADHGAMPGGHFYHGKGSVEFVASWQVGASPAAGDRRGARCHRQCSAYLSGVHGADRV